MSGPDPLQRIAAIAGLILERDLAGLRTAARSRDDSLAHLRALDAAPAEGLDPVAAAQAQLRYQQWADLRRSEINLRLARQTAVWLEAQAQARLAFGRAGVLDNLCMKADAERHRRRDGRGAEDAGCGAPEDS